MTFDQLYLPANCDAADVWAAMHEFELRERRFRFAKVGLVSTLQETQRAIQRLTESFRQPMESAGDRISLIMLGDPDLRDTP